MPEIKNYLPLNRKVFNHEFWTEKRTFSRLEAWLDLLREARYENAETRQLIGNQLVEWKRGELVASLRFLSERWSWSKHKTDNYLKLLKNQGMITTRTAKGTVQTIITICKYDDYNSITEKSGQYGDSTGTVRGQYGDKTNKENKDKKGNYTRDAQFENLVLTYFGFNEQNHFDKMALLSECCIALTNAGLYESFKKQFKNYSEFTNLIGINYKHKFINFLGKQERCFIDGVWNAENWELKLKEEKNKGKSSTEAQVYTEPTRRKL